jgi:hypothetical protein
MRKKIRIFILFLFSLLFTHQPEAKKNKPGGEANKLIEMQLFREKYTPSHRLIENL